MQVRIGGRLICHDVKSGHAKHATNTLFLLFSRHTKLKTGIHYDVRTKSISSIITAFQFKREILKVNFCTSVKINGQVAE